MSKPDKTPQSRLGRKVRLATALPAAYVRIKWGCTDRHARRLIEQGDATPPRWNVIKSMLTCMELAENGHSPADILKEFERCLREYFAAAPAPEDVDVDEFAAYIDGELEQMDASGL